MRTRLTAPASIRARKVRSSMVVTLALALPGHGAAGALAAIANHHFEGFPELSCSRSAVRRRDSWIAGSMRRFGVVVLRAVAFMGRYITMKRKYSASQRFRVTVCPALRNSGVALTEADDRACGTTIPTARGTTGSQRRADGSGMRCRRARYGLQPGPALVDRCAYRNT